MPPFTPTLDSLLRKGYLFKEAIGLFSCDAFADWWASKGNAFTKDSYDLKSRGAIHTFPKDLRSRRTLTFPNPEHFVQLAQAVEKHWHELIAYTSSSTSSLSTLRAPTSLRALDYFQDHRDVLREKIARRVGRRYYLHLDVSRFFPSVYLHRLEAIFPGTNATGHKGGLGSKLDNLSRRMQGNESVGLPLGPDTSFVLAEVLATYLDKALPTHVVSAVRHVDDISIYADSIAMLEKCLTLVHTACEDLRLELNNLKTSQGEVPDNLEPSWVSQLRPLALSIRSTSSLITFFNRSFALHQESGDNRLINYVIAASANFGIQEKNWNAFEALLLTCLPVEPRSISSVSGTLLRARNLGRNLNTKAIVAVYRRFLMRHAQMHQGFEVNRAIWALFELDLVKRITLRDWLAVSNMKDNFVAVTALWLRDSGVNLPKQLALWTKLVSDGHAYTSENWLLTHEARLRGWFPVIAPPTSQFWHVALADQISFIDPMGGLFATEEPSLLSGFSESADAELTALTLINSYTVSL